MTKGFWQELKNNSNLNVDFRISSKRNYADVLNDVFRHNDSVFMSVSFYRGGMDTCGSCLWADINEFIDPDNPKVLNPKTIIAGLNQVIGHQPVPEIRKCHDAKTKTCHTWIDTGSWQGSEIKPMLELHI